VQVPPAQNCRSPHVLPQSPQLKRLAVMSVQTVPPPPGHALPVLGQLHVLPTQTSPGPHIVPHVPQLRGSVVVSVQRPPHTVPLVQTHAPEVHVSAALHACAHEPQ
jgi:hypothetical protein